MSRGRLFGWFDSRLLGWTLLYRPYSMADE